MKNEVQLVSRQNLKDGFYVAIIIHIEALKYLGGFFLVDL